MARAQAPFSAAMALLASLLLCSQASAFLSAPQLLKSAVAPHNLKSLSSRAPEAQALHAPRGLRGTEVARSPALGLKMTEKGGRGLSFESEDGSNIAYDFYPAQRPTVVYLPALNQTRHGSKSFALQTWAKRNNQGFLTADYYGCGRSDGEYKDGTITRWMEDTIALLDKVIKGPVILVGAGVGGWVAMHIAVQKPDVVKGIVGIAADPDFTTDIVLPELDDATKDKIAKDGMAEIMWGLNQYTLSQKLIDDAEGMLLLRGGPKSVPIKCPVRLIQGLGDEEIPPNRALKISEVIETEDVIVTYAKYGGHILDDEEDFRRMTTMVAEIAADYYDYDLTSPTSG